MAVGAPPPGFEPVASGAAGESGPGESLQTTAASGAGPASFSARISLRSHTHARDDA